MSVIHDDTDRFDIFIKQYNPSTKTTLPLNEGCSRRPLNPLVCVFSHKVRRAATFLKKYVTIMSLAERKATEKCSAKYMLFLKYFYSVATLSQFRS